MDQWVAGANTRPDKDGEEENKQDNDKVLLRLLACVLLLLVVPCGLFP
jgi:hypothetical protein